MAAKKQGGKGRIAGANKKSPRDDDSAAPSESLFDRHQILTAVIFFIAGVATNPLISAFKAFRENKSVDAAGTSGKIERKAVELDKPDTTILQKECTDDNLSEFLHVDRQPGMHVVCITSGISQNLTARLFPGAKNSTEIFSFESRPVWADVYDKLESHLRLPKSGRLQQPWAIFTSRGERIVGADDDVPDDGLVTQSLISAEMLVIMEGGTWVWPGVRVGFKRSVDLYSIMPGPPGTKSDQYPGKKAVLETLSLRPLVVSVKGFISKEECLHIQDKASDKIQYSEVTLMDKDKGKKASEWRTSQSAFLPASDSTLIDLDYRTASLTRIPRNHQEHVQVLRYGNGEKYDAHHDFFNPELYKNDQGTLQNIQYGKRNRIATVFWYLSDVAKGGETIFPRHNGAPQPYDFSDCSKGLKVKPEEGKVIIFYSLHANGSMDPLSLHGACRVEDGIKWAANKWVWNAPMGYVR